MTAPSPAGLSPLLDQLDEARAKATPGPWQVVVSGGTDLFTGESYREVEIDFNDPIENAGLVIGEHELAEADAALIVAAVNALPELIAEVRRGRALREAVDGLHTKGAHGMCAGCGWTFPCPTIAILTAALTPGADTAGATA